MSDEEKGIIVHNGQTAKCYNSTTDAIRAFKTRYLMNKTITFMGFSGSGYEDRDHVVKSIDQILSQYDPKINIVNCGATVEGIGMVYSQAVAMGFKTTGIVSALAIEKKVEISTDLDDLYLVQDDSWGGFLDGTQQLSPTSEVMVAVSDIIYAIGGGSVSRDEMIKAIALGKEFHFISADKNHKKTIEKAMQKNLPVPDHFRGEVQIYWDEHLAEK